MCTVEVVVVDVVIAVICIHFCLLDLILSLDRWFFWSARFLDFKNVYPARGFWTAGAVGSGGLGAAISLGS